jgi:hypothetical protein
MVAALVPGLGTGEELVPGLGMGEELVPELGTGAALVPELGLVLESAVEAALRVTAWAVPAVADIPLALELAEYRHSQAAAVN